MTRNLRTLCVAVAFVAMVAIAGFPDAQAQKAQKNINYSHLLATVGMQRTIIQQLSKETVLVALNHQKEETIAQLNESLERFDRTLKGLRDGDAEMKLPAATLPGIVEQLTRIEDLWSLYKSALQQTSEEQTMSRSTVAIVADLNIPLMRAIDGVIAEYKVEASKDHLVSMLAAAVEIGGQQRMLSQKIAKEILLIAYDHETEANKKHLAKSMAAFDSNLGSMIEGNFEIQLLPAPTPKIRGQLRKVQSIWVRFKPIVQETVKSGKISADNIQQVVGMNNSLLEEMGKTLEMYAAL